MPYIQRHFRFRTDTGAVDATPVWGANEDANTFTPNNAAFRLRFSVENQGQEATGSVPYQIYLSKNGGAYSAITTSSTSGIKSSDAGSDADNTSIFVPRLTTPIWMPLSGAAIDLDFVARRYFSSSALNDISLASVLSISRASIGYAKTAAGTLTQFGNDTLRITDLGLLVEDARTNAAFYSQDVSNATWWTVSNCTLAADNTAGPDGTTTADKLTTTGTNGNIRNGSVNPTSQPGATTTAISQYIKINSGSTWCKLVLSAFVSGDSFFAWFNLTGAGAVGTTGNAASGTFTSASIEALGNSWYRVVIVGQLADTTHDRLVQIVGCTTSDNTDIVNTGDSYFVWGTQCETGAFPSSYIPTTTTSATRAADVVSCIANLDSVLGASAGSVLAQSGPPLVAPSAFRMVGYTSGDYRLRFGSDTDASYSDTLGGGTMSVTATLGGGATHTGGQMKTAVGWNSSGASAVGNGGTVATTTGTALTESSAHLGSGYGFDGYYFGYIARVTVWNSRLADATLQGLTAP